MSDNFYSDNPLNEKKAAKLERFLAGAAERKEAARTANIALDAEEAGLGKTIFLLSLILAFGVGVGAYAVVGVALPNLLETTLRAATSSLAAVANAPRPTDSPTINIANASRDTLIFAAWDIYKNATTPIGGVRTVRFTNTDTLGDTRDATAHEVLAALAKEKPSPEILRSLHTSFAFGILTGAEPVGFMTFSSRSYPETFAALLRTEPQIAEGLLPFLRPDVKRSTIPLLRQTPFVDRRVNGAHARVLIDDMSGASVLAYAFIGNNLIIAGGEDALRILLLRSDSLFEPNK